VFFPIANREFTVLRAMVQPCTSLAG